MKDKPKRERIPQSEVLAWLQEHYPPLHADAEVDRDWVWITTNLSGANNKPIRVALSDYGFRFAKRGLHKLPSGKLGSWGHSCEKPLPFKRRRFQGKPAEGKPKPRTTPEEIDEEALAFAMGT